MLDLFEARPLRRICRVPVRIEVTIQDSMDWEQMSLDVFPWA